MISIIITSYKEPRTIGRAIKSFLNQKIPEKYEILALSPDKETAKVIKQYSKKSRKVKYIKDSGKGKPAALNMVFKKAKGKILILTDGDVFVSKNSVSEILKPFSNKEVGAVSGRPISLNPRNTKLGYWSCFLTETAHELRLKSIKKGQFIHCSGYFYAIRAGLVKKIPEDSLADDGVISHMIFNQGYKIAYADKAEVYVKYPDNFADWIKQKTRSAGGYNQLKYLGIKHRKRRSFLWESSLGFIKALCYARNFRELLWTFQLLLARIYLWINIYRKVNLRRLEFKKLWVRIDSTK